MRFQSSNSKRLYMISYIVCTKRYQHKKPFPRNGKERKTQKVCRCRGTTPSNGDSEERELRQSAAAQQVNDSPVPRVNS